MPDLENPLTAYLRWFDSTTDHVRAMLAAFAGLDAPQMFPRSGRSLRASELRRMVEESIALDADKGRAFVGVFSSWSG